MISHDRYFLDRVTERTLDLSFGTLEVYPASYSRYVKLREEREARRRAEYEAQQAFIAKEEESIRRYKAGQRAKEAQGRATRLARVERLEQPREQDRLRLQLAADLRSGRTVLSTSELAVGYPSPWTGNGAVVLLHTPKLTIERGDLAVLVGAFFWSGHILVVDHFSKRIDGLQLSAMQFFVAAILSTIATFLFETPTVKGILGASGAILYAGIIVVGVAFTFQVLGQRNTNPTIAALIMCLEAVFAVVFGYLLLHEVMTTRELLGCALMLAGVILAQLKFGEKPALQDEPAQ